MDRVDKLIIHKWNITPPAKKDIYTQKIIRKLMFEANIVKKEAESKVEMNKPEDKLGKYIESKTNQEHE